MSTLGQQIAEAIEKLIETIKADKEAHAQKAAEKIINEYWEIMDEHDEKVIKAIILEP